MPKDWATCTFEADMEVSQIQYTLSVSSLPDGDDASLLIPVHAYEYTDHFEEKGAQMALATDGADYRVTSSYFGNRNPVDCSYGPGWGKGRLTLSSDGTMKAWFKPAGGSWTQTGKREGSEKTHFVELDTMTEIQYDDTVDLSPAEKGEIATQWRWIRDAGGGWHRPGDVLTLQDGSNNDGEYARIDWLVDQADRTFYFFHSVEV